MIGQLWRFLTNGAGEGKVSLTSGSLNLRQLATIAVIRNSGRKEKGTFGLYRRICVQEEPLISRLEGITRFECRGPWINENAE
jgi:hypothetical protein